MVLLDALVPIVVAIVVAGGTWGLKASKNSNDIVETVEKHAR